MRLWCAETEKAAVYLRSSVLALEINIPKSELPLFLPLIDGVGIRIVHNVGLNCLLEP